MDELIEALTILRKYDNPDFPTHCEHDTLYVLIDPAKVSDEDKARLNELGFITDSEFVDCFMSFKYGSA